MRNQPKLSDQSELKLVIADDHKMVVGAISDFLSRVGGFDVLGAYSLDETLNLLKEHSDVSIVMLDLKMPGMSGISTIKNVVDAAPNAKVVIFSAFADSVLLNRAIENGVKGFIPKSLTAKSLPSILRLVESGQPFFPFSPAPLVSASERKDQLTDVEVSIVRMISDGATNKLIANELGQSETTIKMVMRSICKKLGAKNRAHAAILGRSLLENDVQ